MLPDVIQFLVSAGVIIVAGTFLSKFADEFAERTGFGRLLVGSILLAGATSLPELTVDLAAVRDGMPDLAFGDLLGSSLFNLLILAMLDLSTVSRGHMLSRKAARHALSGNVSAALTGLIAISLLAQPVLGNHEWLGISLGIWLTLAAYALAARMIYYDQLVSRVEATVEASAESHHRGAWGRPAAGFLAAAVVIVIVGPFLASAAGRIADASGLGKSFVGTTLVAFSTSLPELVASLAALRLGSHDLAIGNIFGSNAFNMILFAPLDLAHHGPILASVSQGHALTGLAVMIATLIAVIGQLYQVERRKRLIEPDATLVILVIFAALWLIYQAG